MFSEFAAAPSQFNPGDTIAIPNTPKVGVVVSVFFNSYSNQYVYTVRCPLYPVTVLWAEPAVVASQSADAVVEGDMVIGVDNFGGRFTGVVTGKHQRSLLVRLPDGVYVVPMRHVRSVVPSVRSTAYAA